MTPSAAEGIAELCQQVRAATVAPGYVAATEVVDPTGCGDAIRSALLFVRWSVAGQLHRCRRTDHDRIRDLTDQISRGGQNPVRDRTLLGAQSQRSSTARSRLHRFSGIILTPDKGAIGDAVMHAAQFKDGRYPLHDVQRTPGAGAADWLIRWCTSCSRFVEQADVGAPVNDGTKARCSAIAPAGARPRISKRVRGTGGHGSGCTAGLRRVGRRPVATKQMPPVAAAEAHRRSHDAAGDAGRRGRIALRPWRKGWRFWPRCAGTAGQPRGRRSADVSRPVDLVRALQELQPPSRSRLDIRGVRRSSRFAAIKKSPAPCGTGLLPSRPPNDLRACCPVGNGQAACGAERSLRSRCSCRLRSRRGSRSEQAQPSSQRALFAAFLAAGLFRGGFLRSSLFRGGLLGCSLFRRGLLGRSLFRRRLLGDNLLGCNLLRRRLLGGYLFRRSLLRRRPSWRRLSSPGPSLPLPFWPAPF